MSVAKSVIAFLCHPVMIFQKSVERLNSHQLAHYSTHYAVTVKLSVMFNPAFYYTSSCSGVWRSFEEQGANAFEESFKLVLALRQVFESQAGVWGRSTRLLGKFWLLFAKITPFGDHF